MRCASCQHENQADALFCEGCGVKLLATCAECGAELGAAARFCRKCGTPTIATIPAPQPPVRRVADYTPKHLADKILQSKSALEGERKQVTVLFADVKGSMELAEQLDPEEWHEILDRFFAILTEGVHRFQGTVNQYTGDGIMALFGAPIAHEDHAQRACYAALYLRDQLRLNTEDLRRSRGINLTVRIGLNSGEVVVGRIGDDLRMDYTAQGQTVGLAQRMEQIAAADSTYLTANTARLVEGYFRLRDLGEFNLRGVSMPERVYELQGVGTLRTRLDSSRSRGFSKFVGRTREMKLLDDSLQAAIDGHGQVVGVVAEAGTGKSRLCLEFVERCRARGIRVNEAHCPAHGRTVPYLPLLEMLRDIFAIGANDSDHETRRKIAGELALLDASFQPVLPILFEFMGVADALHPGEAMSPEGRQQRLIDFVRQLVQARSAREPTVYLFDDMHWVDPGSDVFLAHTLEVAAHARALWVVNFRPEYHAAWMSKSFYQQLPLRPLDAEAIASMLADLLGNDASVAGLPARIHADTRGNPFFIEELVQSLVENGSLRGGKGAYRLVKDLDALEIPGTVQNVLAARLDRLLERDKRLLQTAAVIGKDFTGPLLRAVVGTALDDAAFTSSLTTLADAEFIYERALYPQVEYAFKHPLTQEVAYQSQLNVRRAQVHAAVARAVEALEADKLDERAALLAYHWERAGEVLIAARWHARAGRVAGFDSPAEAMRHWNKVWEMLRTTAAGEEALALRLQAASDLLKISWRQGMSEERGRELFVEAKALAVARGDVREQVRLHYGIELQLILSGAARQSVPLLEESLTLADASGDPALRFATFQPFGFALLHLGELDLALEMTTRQIAIARDDPGISIPILSMSLANTWTHRGWILLDLGRFDEAANAFRSCEDLALRFDEHEVISWNDMCAAIMAERKGEVGVALAAARSAIKIGERIGSSLARAMGHGTHGMALTLNGEWASARQSLELALEICRANRVALLFEAYFMAALAEAHLGLGAPGLARELAKAAIQVALRMEMPVPEIIAQLALARVVAAVEGSDGRVAIETALDRASVLVGSTGARSLEPQVLVERARLAGLLANPAERSRRLEQARGLFVEMGANDRAGRVAMMLTGNDRCSCLAWTVKCAASKRGTKPSSLISPHCSPVTSRRFSLRGHVTWHAPPHRLQCGAELGVWENESPYSPKSSIVRIEMG